MSTSIRRELFVILASAINCAEDFSFMAYTQVANTKLHPPSIVSEKIPLTGILYATLIPSGFLSNSQNHLQLYAKKIIFMAMLSQPLPS